MLQFTDRFSASANAMQFSAIRRMHALVQRPGIISFAPGQPDARTFPVDHFQRIAGEIIERERAATFQYIGTRGLAPLLEAVVAYAARKGIAATPAQASITEGSQQAIDLVARVLVDPGDAVLVELPSYVGALSAFRAARAKLVGVRLDAAGIDLDHLRAQHAALVAAGVRVKLLYVMPTFQNPAGVSYTAERRRELLALARELDLVIVEDDPYGDLYFEDAPQPPLKSFDTEHRVIYLSSFSKVLAPGLRSGFVIGADELLAKIEVAKQAANLCGSALEQRIVLACLTTGMLAEQQAALRPFYRGKCAVLLAALAAEMPAGIEWTRPAGGLFVWATLPAHIDADALLMAAVEAGVAYVPGASFFVEAVQKNTMRLTFAGADDAKITEGIGRLARVVRAAL